MVGDEALRVIWSFRTKELTVAFSWTYILPASGCASGADGWTRYVTCFTGEIDHVSYQVLAFPCVLWDVSVLNSWGLWTCDWQKKTRGQKEADQTTEIEHICSSLLPSRDKEICKLPHTWSKRRISLIFQKLLWVELVLNVSHGLLPVVRICVFILTFCPVKIMQECLNPAWCNHSVDINTSMHSNNPRDFLSWENAYGKWLQKWHWGPTFLCCSGLIQPNTTNQKQTQEYLMSFKSSRWNVAIRSFLFLLFLAGD